MPGPVRVLCQAGSDPKQALKLAIAAALTGSEVEFAATESQSEHTQEHLQATLPDGSQLADPNSIARFLGGCFQRRVDPQALVLLHLSAL